MNSPYVWILVLLAVALIALFSIWYAARRFKRDLDAPPATTGAAKLTLTMTPATVARLKQLSVEPILLKQNGDGVRVQIEHRPMLPLLAFVGNDVRTALSEAAARVTQQCGPRWIVLLTAREDGTVSAQRLS